MNVTLSGVEVSKRLITCHIRIILAFDIGMTLGRGKTFGRA